MNRTRREKIDSLIEQLDVLKSDIESLTDDEQTAYDNLPETIQTGNRGELMMSAIDNLESAVSSVEEAIDYLNEARGE
ncbi:hypothetical protein [Victivallis sp.]|uniref:hypothetical protein n=1 Tax=Victivallis sp. TaxID=2049020 RepID=UPI003A8FF096